MVAESTRPIALPATKAVPAKDIHAAIAEVYGKVGYVQKSRSKEGGVPYSFAGEKALIEAIRPAMVEAGIYMHVLECDLPFRETYTTKNGTIMNRTAVGMTVRFTHAASGTFIDVQSIGEGSDAGDKSHAKALTIGFKYALRQTFCIETGDDPDDGASQKQERAPQPATPAKAAARSAAPVRPPAPPIPDPREGGPAGDKAQRELYRLAKEMWPDGDAHLNICRALSLPNSEEGVIRGYWLGNGGTYKQAQAYCAEVRRIQVKDGLRLDEAALKVNAYAKISRKFGE